MRRLVPPAIFSAVACVMTWPLAIHPASRIAALSGFGDAFLNLWVLGWNLRIIATHPAWLFTGRVFDANIFYPASSTLAYTDHQIPQALAMWPVYAATGNLTLCYNLVFFLSLVLSAWAMFVLIERTTGSAIAAWVAGLIWGFCPFHFGHLPNIQLQALYWMPLTFLALDAVIVSAGRVPMRRILWLGTTAGLQMVTSLYYGVIGGVGLVVVIALALVARKVDRRLFLRLVLAGVVALVVAAPWLWPYWRLDQQEGGGRTVIDAEHGSAIPSSYVLAPPTNLLYGQTGWLRLPPGGDTPERHGGSDQELFPGFVVLVLAIAGLAAWRVPERRHAVACLAAVGVAGLILSFGPRGIRPMYVALHNYVPGFQGIRAPSRFSVLVFFSLAGLAGIGVAWLARAAGDRRRAWVAAVALSLIGIEYLNGSIPYAPAPELPTATARWLRDAPEPGPVVYLPIGDVSDDSFDEVASLEHARPIVNGHSGREPALYRAMADQLSTFPGPEALLTLRDLSIRFVVSKQPIALPAGPTPLVTRASLADGTIYELRWTAELDAAVRHAASPTPLPAGPPPFDRHEVATYRVHWVGGPMALPAGEIVISADRAGNDTIKVSAHVTTASWMKLFFEADDTIETDADVRFLPRAYREAINEGRRHRRRTVEYDHAQGDVKIKDGDGAPVTLPLLREARDPLTTLFYIRTLPLRPGFEAPILINAAGRSSMAIIKVGAEESIVIDGKPQDALRIEPTFPRHLALSNPPRATVWISRDARKVPLRLRVSASFGTVELELVGYQSR